MFWNVRAMPARLICDRRVAVDSLAGEADVTATRRIDAGDQVERGRLARAVRADQADEVADVHLQREVADGAQPAEVAA